MNANKIVTKTDINLLTEKMNFLIEEISKLKTETNSPKEIYLTSKEVMEIYKISKSQLSDLRAERKIPYSKPFGVIIYPKSEIEKIIGERMMEPNILFYQPRGR